MKQSIETLAEHLGVVFPEEDLGGLAAYWDNLYRQGPAPNSAEAAETPLAILYNPLIFHE